jgi:protein-disulfide isomerase
MKIYYQTNKFKKNSLLNLFNRIMLLALFSIVVYNLLYIQYNNDLYIFSELVDSSLTIENILKSNSPFLGNIKAPVTILDFSDFQCPNCGRYVKNTEPLINETYVQTGKVNLVYKYFPVVGFDSFNSALAGQCSQEQGKFWQFHKLLFANQKQIDSGWVSKANLENLAAQISGMDGQKFSECLTSERYTDHVNSDLDMAKKFELRGTPSFIIVKSDGTDPSIITGAHPFPSFQALIENKLRN